MQRFFISIATVLFFNSALEAAFCLEMDSKKLLKCTFSYRHHNRIVVEGQRIKKVFYTEDEVLIRTEEESGQVFVQALVEHPAEITVSIITKEGLVQDIELDFTDKSSEILILRNSLLPLVSNANSLDDPNMCFEGDSSLIQNAIEMMMAGKVPEEYVPIADRQICCQIKGKVTSNSLMRLIGPVYTIYAFLIENKGYRTVRLHEQEVNCVHGEWVFIERNELKRDEKMMALIGVRTYEQ